MDEKQIKIAILEAQVICHKAMIKGLRAFPYNNDHYTKAESTAIAVKEIEKEIKRLKSKKHDKNPPQPPQ